MKPGSYLPSYRHGRCGHSPGAAATQPFSVTFESSGHFRRTGVILRMWPWAARSYVNAAHFFIGQDWGPVDRQAWGLARDWVYVTSHWKGLLNVLIIISCSLFSPSPALVLFLGVTVPSCHLPCSLHLPRILKSTHETFPLRSHFSSCSLIH